MMPICSTEAIFITAAMEAHKGCNMAVIDLPGTFLPAEMDEHIIMVLMGELAQMMAMIDPKLYRKYVMTDQRGRLILYIKCIGLFVDYR